jgi:hypothetical protein
MATMHVTWWRLLFGVPAVVAVITTVLHLLPLGLAAQTADAQDNKTAWDGYKNSPSRPSTDQHLTDPVLVGAIDLHAHSDPDSYPRQWDGFDVARLAKDRGMRAVVLKNHWTETAGLAYLVRKRDAGHRGIRRIVARYARWRHQPAGGSLYGRCRRPLRADRVDADSRLGARGQISQGES